MSEIQKQCSGCGELFPEAKLSEEIRERDGELVGAFVWCGVCLIKEVEKWEKQSGKKRIEMKLE
jgi:hypothetical protein